MARPDFPKTVQEFRERFADERVCLEYLAQSRWPEGFVCPKCSSKEAWLNPTRFLYECRKCRKQTSPTAGTVMHRSHFPIYQWFWAAYFIATHTPGISALQLRRQLGITSHENSWHMLQRLRRGMVNDSRSPLKGLIEADETIIGGPAKGMRGRGSARAAHKSLVIGAVEVVTYIVKKGSNWSGPT